MEDKDGYWNDIYNISGSDFLQISGSDSACYYEFWNVTDTF